VRGKWIKERTGGRKFSELALLESLGSEPFGWLLWDFRCGDFYQYRDCWLLPCPLSVCHLEQEVCRPFYFFRRKQRFVRMPLKGEKMGMARQRSAAPLQTFSVKARQWLF
jgi:hypothetical protein